MRHGDIAVNVGRSTIRCPDRNCYWPKSADGLVYIPYTLSAVYTPQDVSLITTAMLEFASLTCVRFVPRTNEKDYLNIISDKGCWSLLGRIGGVQDLSLQTVGCLTHGVTQHELNHAVGFEHEHSRGDRDSYIVVMWDNILPDYKGTFNKTDTNNLGLAYDYSSVMHYGKYTFSINYQLPTIKPIPNNFIPIGQRYGLSNLDVAKINKLYDCNVCSSVLLDDKGTLFSPTKESNYLNNNCSWLIRIPSDKVLLQFEAFDVQVSKGCTANYIRVYDGPGRNSALLLDRFCETGQLPLVVSSMNTMLVEFITDNSVSAAGFRASYTTVKCGGTFITPSGNVSTPGFGNSKLYQPFSNCTWSIIAPAGNQVRLEFLDFSLEDSYTCSYDYMEAIDGMMATSTQVGIYCGTRKVPPITSTKNALVLRFFSDASSESTGFQARYSFVSAI
ncbi:astacin-like metalloendopeptidase [Pelobates cultripes]|uniref:Metalloendopeptidase n=2 Tax=Pelobates cultripes TaxID=61616 RepID=A0AAD1TGM0_PELCU|nr:astacin-like metalloendopeptidase [Pelobates cultripes]